MTCSEKMRFHHNKINIDWLTTIDYIYIKWNKILVMKLKNDIYNQGSDLGSKWDKNKINEDTIHW